MKNLLVRLLLALKTTRQLGLAQTGWYAVYQLGLRSGHFRRAAPCGWYKPLACPIRSPFQIPDPGKIEALPGADEAQASLLAEAEEIVAGKVRLFGGPAIPLNLKPKDATKHWTAYEGRPRTWGVDDIKDLWEPARFGWVYPLGRAYRATRDDRYPAAFWQNLETFLQANPPNQGPNWSSAQEAALRILAWLFAVCAFEGSPETTPNRLAILAGTLAAHAQRIPPTLSYARAQNNNHLISEALGLYAAGCALPEHPQAPRWQQTGWRWLNLALQRQIRPDGSYVQHSTNYHRLMLHAALQARLFGKPYPAATLKRLSLATTWLLAQVDPLSGRAPNLGANDGACILPLAPGGFPDFRPVAQAAAQAFLNRPAFPPGPWDELSLWLGQPVDGGKVLLPLPKSQAVHRVGSPQSWGTLRAVQFQERPSHADQLHVDLWWRGENVAIDAGSYRYTAAAPWDNALAETLVHNTVLVAGQNQMLRAGRFLWLDWAQGRLLDTRNFRAEILAAEHDGYRHLGIVHRRTLKRASPDHWLVSDSLLPRQALPIDALRLPIYLYRLHWLLPDWPWTLDQHTLSLERPDGGRLSLTLLAETPPLSQAGSGSVSLVRAGKTLSGPDKAPPTLGWYAPTYGMKNPALSFSLLLRSPLPFHLHSQWTFEDPA